MGSGRAKVTIRGFGRAIQLCSKTSELLPKVECKLSHLVCIKIQAQDEYSMQIKECAGSNRSVFHSQ